MGRHWATWLLAGIVGGCGPATKAPPGGGPTTSEATVEPRRETAVAEAPVTAPEASTANGGVGDQRDLARIVEARDAVALIRPQVNISIFQMSVPGGTLTRNEPLWKRIDETAIDVRASEILGRNGLRVGLGNLSRLEEFMGHLQKGPMQEKPAIYAASGTRTIELEMKKGVPGQIVYHYDLQGEMPVRSFDDCDNLFCIEFEPAPRKAGDVRIGLCPMVRSLRTRIVAVGEVDTREIQFVQPEKFLDVNLRVDVPLDKFLVIAPSPEARNSMSIGGAFMTREGGVERIEEVMVIIPQAMKAKERAVDEKTNTE